MKTALNNVLLPTLFNVVNTLFSIVTPDCGLIQAQQCRTILLTTLNNVRSTTLFKAVFIKQVVGFLLCSAFIFLFTGRVVASKSTVEAQMLLAIYILD